MTDEDIYEKANKKVKAKKGFLYHFVAYAFTLGILYAIMYFNNSENLLPIVLTALSWGIGLAIHYLKTFGTEHLEAIGLSPDWEEDELEYEIEKLKRKRELKEQLQQEKNLLDEVEEGLALKQIEKRLLDED